MLIDSIVYSLHKSEKNLLRYVYGLEWHLAYLFRNEESFLKLFSQNTVSFKNSFSYMQLVTSKGMKTVPYTANKKNWLGIFWSVNGKISKASFWQWRLGSNSLYSFMQSNQF